MRISFLVYGFPLIKGSTSEQCREARNMNECISEGSNEGDITKVYGAGDAKFNKGVQSCITSKVYHSEI